MKYNQKNLPNLPPPIFDCFRPHLPDSYVYLTYNEGSDESMMMDALVKPNLSFLQLSRECEKLCKRFVKLMLKDQNFKHYHLPHLSYSPDRGIIKAKCSYKYIYPNTKEKDQC